MSNQATEAVGAVDVTTDERDANKRSYAIGRIYYGLTMLKRAIDEAKIASVAPETLGSFPAMDVKALIEECKQLGGFNSRTDKSIDGRFSRTGGGS